jgi:ketosteroid isomerase-like protein
MTDTTASHLALVRRWEDTFNNDLEALVHEVYAPDAVLGGIVMGPEKLLRFERRVLAAAPRRFMRVERSHVAGDVVTVEGALFDPDQGDEWTLPFCVVLTIADGKVVRDDTYTEFSRWPGMRG